MVDYLVSIRSPVFYRLPARRLQSRTNYTTICICVYGRLLGVSKSQPGRKESIRNQTHHQRVPGSHHLAGSALASCASRPSLAIIGGAITMPAPFLYS
jgi:hypothetical protein